VGTLKSYGRYTATDLGLDLPPGPPHDRHVGLLKNLRILLSENVLSRMTELENRQDLLEEHTAARLDSMKAYSARVIKRERDERGRSRNGDSSPAGSLGTPVLSEAAQRLYARRAGRHGNNQ